MLGQIVRDKVVIVANTACDELEQISLQRGREIEVTEEELEKLQAEVDATKVDSI